ncbi:hypothetical protein ACEPAF_9413 [Sanghuangporus sanghuang]|uniref:Uncharacterized protein n=1 Tax=Sanghuangporus baumii TaxID=108892 RepID=A0A9Q5HTK5_SANBA|nr:hypothetical protein A7U60_g7387 [Sanghuangporus baumii]
MSNYPTSAGDDAASISNQPLIPKPSEPKDYEAAAGALMSSYGFSGGVPPIPEKDKKKKKSKGKSKKSKDKKAAVVESGNNEGQASTPSSTNAAG